ncbi:MAG TPA: hypothetical protein VGL75_02440 [Acidothermaceae bacterium]
MPVAVATPPVIVHDVGTNTAGFSPADDNDTEVCTGMVIDGPAGAAADETATVADGGASAPADAVDTDDVDADEADAADGEGEVVGAAGSEAFLLPACLPKRKAPTHSPIRTTVPTAANARWLDLLIDATLPLT